MFDMTYMRHDSYLWYRYLYHVTMEEVWHDLYVTWLIRDMTYMWHDSYLWYRYLYHVTMEQVWHDLYVTPLICDTTYMWHDLYLWYRYLYHVTMEQVTWYVYHVTGYLCEWLTYLCECHCHCRMILSLSHDIYVSDWLVSMICREEAEDIYIMSPWNRCSYLYHVTWYLCEGLSLSLWLISHVTCSM